MAIRQTSSRSVGGCEGDLWPGDSRGKIFIMIFRSRAMRRRRRRWRRLSNIERENWGNRKIPISHMWMPRSNGISNKRQWIWDHWDVISERLTAGDYFSREDYYPAAMIGVMGDGKLCSASWIDGVWWSRVVVYGLSAVCGNWKLWKRSFYLKTFILLFQCLVIFLLNSYTFLSCVDALMFFLFCICSNFFCPRGVRHLFRMKYDQRSWFSAFRKVVLRFHLVFNKILVTGILIVNKLV